MLEFVFKKSALQELIAESSDPAVGNVVVQLAFDHGDNGGFIAKVSAYCEGGESEGSNAIMAVGSMAVAQISGCPRPPGCG